VKSGEDGGGFEPQSGTPPFGYARHNCLRAFGQAAKLPVVGYLGAETPELFKERLLAFNEGLRETGFEAGGHGAVHSTPNPR